MDTDYNIIDNSNYRQEEEQNPFMQSLYLIFYNWRLVLISTVISLLFIFFFVRYTNSIFQTTAKIKILDPENSSLEILSTSDLFDNNKINLENEIEVLISKPIISKVINNLNIDIRITAVGDIMKTMTTVQPFKVVKTKQTKAFEGQVYKVSFKDDGLYISNLDEKDNVYYFKNFTTKGIKHKLPFQIVDYDLNLDKQLKNEHYLIEIKENYKLIEEIKNSLKISQIGKESDLISISNRSQEKNYSQILINELIDVFNEDGIADRRLVHKRTIEFIDKRFEYLSSELDSIENKKKIFKIQNNLTNLSDNARLSYELSLKSDEELFNLENQISISKLLLRDLDKEKNNLLPSKIGIDNDEINSLIENHNKLVLENKKLIQSAGSNNPTYLLNIKLLDDIRENIDFTVNNYLKELEITLNEQKEKNTSFIGEVSALPVKEQILRTIERNQSIKETLYMFLLEKREEAQVSFAITEPSIKIVESATSLEKAVYPSKGIMYLLGLIFGILFPTIIIKLIETFDTKIYSAEDVNAIIPNAPIIAEVPHINESVFVSNSNDRTILAESFRIINSNINYYIKKSKSNVIFSTSSTKGEGKTFVAFNLAKTYSNLNKKTLLIGCDLRNPQIHTYIDINKNEMGLVDYLVDNKNNWKKFVWKSNENLDILISGKIPPNPTQLLSNGNFEKLIENAKKEYEIIIVDTAPSLLVSDTLVINKSADLTLFTVRCSYTQKDTLNYITDCIKNSKFNNIAVLINSLGKKSRYGYQYSYRYNYSYKYNYNYGYGYGYSEEQKNS